VRQTNSARILRPKLGAGKRKWSGGIETFKLLKTLKPLKRLRGANSRAEGSGVEEVLGSGAFYFDPYNFEQSLGNELYRLSRTPRSELHRRGAAIHEKVIREFSWKHQGRRLAEFLERDCIGARASAHHTALAA
jgi:hypothetical protein